MKTTVFETFLNYKKLIAISTAISVLLSLLLTLIAFRVWVDHNPVHHSISIGLVDINFIREIREKIMAQRLLTPGVTEEQKKAEMASVQNFGAELEKIVGELPDECECIVMAEGAYIGGGHKVQELTSVVLKRLGLDSTFSALKGSK